MRSLGENSPFKTTTTIGVVVFLLLSLFFAAQYFINRPNYRDLQKEFARIQQFIPPEWQQVSQGQDTGVLGLFCWGLDNSACPNITTVYKSEKIVDSAYEISFLESFLKQSEYEQTRIILDMCADDEKDMACEYSLTKNGFGLRLIISHSVYEQTKYMTVYLGQRDGMGTY